MLNETGQSPTLRLSKPEGGCPVSSIIVKIPGHLKGLAQAIQETVDRVHAFERDARRQRVVDYRAHERALGDTCSEIERQCHAASLSSLDEDRRQIRINGVVHVRVLRGVAAEYKTRVGPVRVLRSLFRPVGERNGKTVNTVTLRSGAVADEWLPDTASAMAYRLARGTSREAEQAGEVERTLPYSHSSFEKIGHVVGCEIRRLLDLWHVLEKLGEALAVFELADAERKVRLAAYRRMLCTRRDAPAAILAELRASGRENLTDKECPVHAAITYFENQSRLMNYVDARRDGLPIGSGNVEATCKSLIALRMKRPGSRWKTPTGGNVLTMRAHLLSDRWVRASELALPVARNEIHAA